MNFEIFIAEGVTGAGVTSGSFVGSGETIGSSLSSSVIGIILSSPVNFTLSNAFLGTATTTDFPGTVIALPELVAIPVTDACLPSETNTHSCEPSVAVSCAVFAVVVLFISTAT